MKKIIKNNWDLLIAFVATWISPLLFLFLQAIHFYRYNNSSIKIKFCLAGALCLGVLLIIYFKKIKKWIGKKLDQAETRGIPKQPIYVLLNGIMTIITFVFGIMIATLLEMFCGSVKDYLCIITIFEIIGAVFYFVHALRMQN